MLDYVVKDTYGIIINCKGCTYKIEPLSIDIQDEYDPCCLNVNHTATAGLSTPVDQGLSKYAEMAMSVYIGRQLGIDNINHPNVHDGLEAAGLDKTREDSDSLLASNYMTEFRQADFMYVVVGILQSSQQALWSLENQPNEFPSYTLQHLSYLLMNSERLPEFLSLFKVQPRRHADTTQITCVCRLVRRAILKFYTKFKIHLLFACGLTFFKSDDENRHRYFWTTFVVKAIKELGMGKVIWRRAFLTGRVGSGDIEDWFKSMDLNLYTQLSLILIPCEYSLSLIFWRENHENASEVFLPLTALIHNELINEDLEQKGEEMNANDELQIFNSNLISNLDTCIIHDRIPHLWCKWVHHCERPIGRISTSASKFFHVLSFLNLEELKTKEGRIITLAEGSGSILNLLLHYFPKSYAIYNTLQKDSVEVKMNFLNVSPPSIMGDKCHLEGRLLGLKELNLGETDIMKESFQNKLLDVIDRSKSFGPIFLITIDAEEKENISNCEKLKVYAPICNLILDQGGVFVNKMFIRTTEDIDEIELVLQENGMTGSLIKPFGSHAENNEVYLICKLSDECSKLKKEGRTNVLLQRIVKGNFGEESCVKSRMARINYLKDCLRIGKHYLSNQSLRSHCLWWENWFIDYDVHEIGPWFFTFQHMYNLICCLMTIDSKLKLMDKETGRFLPSTYVNKHLVSCLITVGISVLQQQRLIDLVYIFDTLSCVELIPDIIPSKHVVFNYVYVPIERECESVIGTIGDNMKDIFRALNLVYHDSSIKNRNIKRLAVWDSELGMEVFTHNMFSRIYKDVRKLSLNKLNGFLLYDEIKRKI